jgi:hypothetical protein
MRGHEPPTIGPAEAAPKTPNPEPTQKPVRAAAGSWTIRLARGLIGGSGHGS